jgi:hypothetical protein
MDISDEDEVEDRPNGALEEAPEATPTFGPNVTYNPNSEFNQFKTLATEVRDRLTSTSMDLIAAFSKEVIQAMRKEQRPLWPNRRRYVGATDASCKDPYTKGRATREVWEKLMEKFHYTPSTASQGIVEAKELEQERTVFLDQLKANKILFAWVFFDGRKKAQSLMTKGNRSLGLLQILAPSGASCESKQRIAPHLKKN